MAGLTGAVADWLASHRGVVDRPTLRGLDLTDRVIDGLVSSGQLIPVHRGVFRLAAVVPSFEQECAVASTIHAAGAVSRRAAGRLWGLRKMGRVPLEFMLPHGNRSTIVGVSVHRCRDIQPEDIVMRDDGIRLTRPPRTAFDLAAVLDHRHLESVIGQIIDKYCSYATLQRQLDRLWVPGRPGGAKFARVLGSRPPHDRAADSDPEVALARALREAGRSVRQCPVRADNGLCSMLTWQDRANGWPLKSTTPPGTARHRRRSGIRSETVG
jgi:hypothetical protein